MSRTGALPGLGDDEGGQTIVEYALIIALISVAAIGVLVTMTSAIDGVFMTLMSAL